MSPISLNGIAIDNIHSNKPRVPTARIGVLGTGQRGIYCFAKLLETHPEAELAALCDSNSVRLSGAQDVLGRPISTYVDLHAMIREEALDGLIITTPDYLHANHVVLALEAGVPHVLVDKPLATNAADCLRIAGAMQESGGQVAVGFNLRHLPLLGKIKEIIASGDLGDLMLLENSEFHKGGRTYMARWNRFYAFSGGLWVHKGSHDFDVFNWWNSGGLPTRVSAFAGLNALRPDKLPFKVEADRPVGPNCSDCAYLQECPDAAPYDTELWNPQAAHVDHYVKDVCIFLSEKDTHDNGIAIVEYDNNVRASHSECFACGFSDRIYTLTGTKGTLLARLSHPTQIEFRPRWGESQFIEVTLPEREGGHGGADPILLDNFLSAVRGATSHAANLHDGLNAVAVGQAAELSWREHRTIEISELADLQNPFTALASASR